MKNCNFSSSSSSKQFDMLSLGLQIALFLIVLNFNGCATSELEMSKSMAVPACNDPFNLIGSSFGESLDYAFPLLSSSTQLINNSVLHITYT